MRVLAVCTGNICRSPATERLLAAALGVAHRGAAPLGGVEVGSAGTRALVGYAMTDEMAALVAADGASPAGFTARRLTADLVAQADLVLALTRAHRSEVVALQPAAVRRTFTLRELARLVAGARPDEVRATGPDVATRLVALPELLAPRRRAAHRPDDDDVVDPYGRGAATYLESHVAICAAVRALADAVRDPEPAPVPGPVPAPVPAAPAS
ncbi:low molecular weight phosphatase family protein [Cellulomonas composti]|uniref:Low molecular weight phosphatase family protein n=1 Tax=Cellulomonas composti TaxID=266130 RepID=A0A511JCX1_9CELL|nr:low molecular weight phosphatase family protein [Cellulomonas composti]